MAVTMTSWPEDALPVSCERHWEGAPHQLSTHVQSANQDCERSLRITPLDPPIGTNDDYSEKVWRNQSVCGPWPWGGEKAVFIG